MPHPEAVHEPLPRPAEVIDSLRALVDSLGAATCRIGGSIGFEVLGHGSWRVDLDQPGGRWGEDARSADAHLRATGWGFSVLFERPDCLPELIELGQIQVEGETALIGALGEAVARGATPLALRATPAEEP